jgi:hypothetical protein
VSRLRSRIVGVCRWSIEMLLSVILSQIGAFLFLYVGSEAGCEVDW